MMSFKKIIGRITKKVIEEAPNFMANIAAKTAENAAETNNSGENNSSTEKVYGGFTLEQWERRWITLGNLDDLTVENLKPYNKSIGLYKATENGKVKYIGRAIEHSNGGFRKRLRDYVRPSDSGRKHQSGQTMNANAENLVISILVMGNSAGEVNVVKELERVMINHYGHVSDIWNVQRN